MEERDQGLKYQSELINVKRIVKQIQELGINTRKIEIIIDKIEQDLKNEEDKIYNTYDAKESIEDLLKEGNYSICYSKAISNLTTLKLKLIEEYNIYYKIHGSCLSIESNLENPDENNLPTIIELILETLKNLKKSSTINYDDEKQLVEKVYQLAYQLIKVELIYKNDSIVLNKVLQSEIDTNFIEKYLLEEISTLDCTKEENKYILNRIKVLKEKGLESTYLDLELLNLLKYQSNPELIDHKKNFITTTYTALEQQESQRNWLESRYQILETEYQQHKNAKIKIQKSILKYSSYFVLYLSIISGTVIGLGTLAKKWSTTKTYSTITQTYDVEKDQFSEIEKYLKQAEDTTYLKQYFPYEDISDQYYNNYDYVREIHTYDVSDIYYENLEDYASIDLEKLKFAPKITQDYKYTLNPSDYYQDPRTVIERIAINKGKMEPETSVPNFIFLLIVLNMVPFTVELYILYYCGFRDFEEDHSWFHKLTKYREALKQKKIYR